MDCLENIVGLASEECICYTPSANFPQENESSSGLYISASNSIPLNFLDEAVFCGTDGIYELIKNSRTEAITQFKGDFSTKISELYKFAPRSFDHVGNERAPAPIFVDKNYAGYALRIRELRGGLVVLSGVRLKFSSLLANSSVTVQVFTEEDLSTPIATESVVLTGTRQWHDVSFSSPIEITTNYQKDVFVVYEIPNGAVPSNNKNTSKTCGTCGSGAGYDPHLDVMQVSGIAVNAPSELKFNCVSNKEGYGMILDAGFECDILSWLCKASKESTRLTYSGDTFIAANAIARAIMHKSRWLLADSIIRSNRISTFTMLDTNRDVVLEGMDYDSSQYGIYISLLARTYPAETTGCLTHRSGGRIIKSY